MPDSARTRSRELFERARSLIPGGVDSPVRAFGAVGGTPVFAERAKGAFLWDADGNRYVDYVMSWGPLINGHAFDPVVRALEEVGPRGTSFGMPSRLEIELAELISSAMPTIELVRFVSSGTEAAMSAVRLARGFSGRDLVVKFAGNYHGHADALLARAGSGSLTFGVPTSPGIPAGAAADTLVADYNDTAGLERLFRQHGPAIAAVIVEPIAGNMGVVPPKPGFLRRTRELTAESGSLLIFDEVITGFRVGGGGAQSLYDISPDLTVLGKIIGGGLPVGGYGGRRDVMEVVAPVGPVYQAGTLSGNPLAMAAGAANLRPLGDPELYQRLYARTERLESGLRAAAAAAGIAVTVNAVTGMLTVFFGPGAVTTLEEAERSDTAMYARFFHEMLDRGYCLPPSQFEAWMLSDAHTEEIIDRTIAAATDAFGSLVR